MPTTTRSSAATWPTTTTSADSREAAQQRLGPVDIVFANAGIAPHHDTTAMTEEQWQRMFDIDVKGVWLLCRAFLPGMLERGSGSIIITASQLGLVGYPGLAATPPPRRR